MPECPKHEGFEARIKAAENDIKCLYDRIRPLEDSKSRTEEIVKSLKESFDNLSKNINAKIDVLTTKIEALKDKPGERWEKLIWVLIGCGIAAAFNYFTKK